MKFMEPGYVVIEAVDADAYALIEVECVDGLGNVIDYHAIWTVNPAYNGIEGTSVTVTGLIPEDREQGIEIQHDYVSDIPYDAFDEIAEEAMMTFPGSDS